MTISTDKKYDDVIVADAAKDRFSCDEEWAPATSRRKFVLNLLCPFLLVAVINLGFILKIRYKPLLWHDYVATYKQEMAAEKYEPPLELLILGDSTGNQAVQASLYDILDMPGRNLCTYANVALVGDAWILDSYLQNNIHPKYVVMVHAAKALPWQALERGMIHRFPARHQSGFDANLSFSQEVDSLLNYWLPLCYSRSTVQKCTRRPWRLVRSFEFCPWDYSGCMYFDQRLDDSIYESVDRNLELLKQPPRVSDMNKRALTYMLDTARTKGFKIIYVSAPMYDGLYNSSGFAKYNQELMANLQEVTSQYSDVFTIDSHQYLASFEQMGADSVHINTKGAEIFTKKLAERLSEIMVENEQSDLVLAEKVKANSSLQVFDLN